MQKIGVIGAGAWGTALAQCIANGGHNVIMWAREPDVVKSINQDNRNSIFLPDIDLNSNISATDSLTEVTTECDVLLIATPAQSVRPTLQSLKADVGEGKPFVICAKGIELETGFLMSQVVEEVVPNASFGILTGPTFASEIARGLPSAVTIAAKDKDIAQQIIDGISNRSLRTYITDDVLGAQIGGALKNVIAIACGVIEGRGMGESARAALITRGLAEMARLANAMGARKETLMGMCGVGDIVLTCSSLQSRNFSLGVALGQGKKMEEVLKDRRSVTEGVSTSRALKVMAQNHAIDMPISEAVHLCLNEGMSIEDAIEKMLDRPMRSEAA